MFFQNIDNEQSGRQTIQIGNTAQSLFQLGTLTRDLQFFTLRQIVKRSVLFHFIDGRHLLHSLTNRREVSQHTTRPTLDNIWHIHSRSLVGDNLFGLFLSSDEQNFFARFSDRFQCSCGFVDLCYGFIQVDNVDTVTLHENIRSHSRIPFSFQVPKMNTGFQ